MRHTNDTAPPLFRASGPDVTPADNARLGEQQAHVTALMLDGKWRTLAEISAAVGAPEASVSARLRDMRKERNGAYVVERARRSAAQWEYRVAGTWTLWEGRRVVTKLKESGR